MVLSELFEDNDINMVSHLRRVAMDYLTPLVANNIKKVHLKDIIDCLSIDNTGVVLTRGLIMKVLDPNICKMVKKIDKDMVYVQFPVGEIAKNNQEDEEKAEKKIKKKVSNDAMKSVKKK